tara:strand:+ start:399 stop:1013 length:615 start_codon:yes stop_codon:yes gene_type:complete
MNYLAFGAHPDDLEIGMGGTLAKLAANKKNNVTGVIATLSSQESERKQEQINAAQILGIEIELLEIDFHKLFSSRFMVKTIDNLIEKYKPDVIFTHWNHDSHQDHNVLTDGVIAATRKNKCSVFMYEQTLPGGVVTESFRAQAYVDITGFIEKKIDSVDAHKTQISKNNKWWLNGIKGRAMYRGNQIGIEYAEAFEVIKLIKPF